MKINTMSEIIISPKYLSENMEPLDLDKSFETRQVHIEDLLCRYLNLKTVTAFIGTGTSMPLRYPSWNRFAEEILVSLRLLFGANEDLRDKLLQEGITEAKTKNIVDSFQKELELTFEFELNKIQNEIKTKKRKRKNKKCLVEEILQKYLFSLENFINKPPDEDELKDTGKRYKDKEAEFHRYFEYITAGRDSELNAQVILGECERHLVSKVTWEAERQSKIVRAIIKSYFENKHAKVNDDDVFDENKNPYLALLDLPIKKFVTLNYDVELERALLIKSNRIVKSNSQEYSTEFVIKNVGDKSFSQNKKNCTQLARFSVARYEASKDSVFHCHGRIDDINSCVVSEDDYQKWYLRDDEESYAPLRQTLDLLLDSTPILFLGFGLKDADLMRMLRMITANRTTESTRKPLFCLYYVMKENFKAIEDERGVIIKPKKWNSEKEVEDECTALYLKYGLHVIPVYESESPNICDKLRDIDTKQKEWREGIIQKPRFRKQQVNQEFYFHYKFKTKEEIAGIDDKLFYKLNKLLKFNVRIRSQIEESVDFEDYLSKREIRINNKETLNFAPHLAVVLGDGGTGKSWGVQRYLEKLKKLKNMKIFFWSSYYANDVLTGVDRLLQFFGVKSDGSQERKFEELKKIVDTEENAVIVFDGIEKLLNPNEKKTEGESVSPEVREFFKIISNGNVKKRIILTTRLFPTDLLFNIEEKIKGEKETEEIKKMWDDKADVWTHNILPAPKCWLESLESVKDFEPIKNDLSAVCSLVDGHVFCISLIRGILKNPHVETKAFIANIAGTPIDNRIQKVIELAIKNLDDENRTDNLARKFIERIALFMHPIRREVAEVCYDEIKNGENQKGGFMKLLDKLVERNLLQEIETYPRQHIPEHQYVAHPLIRGFVFEELHKSLFASLPSLQLPGFTSSKEIVDPGRKEGKNIAKSLFLNLCNKAKEKIEIAEDKSKRKEDSEKDEKISSDMCRGAFSILRSRFCSNTVARWGDYNEYLMMIVRLYDTAKRVSPRHWNYNEPTPAGIEKCEADIAPLYADELAWVYNEIGLVFRTMGSNLNSTAFWEQGFEINKLIDMEKSGRYLFQSQFSLGTGYTYFGKLHFAKAHLDNAFEIANRLENKGLASRVLGYMALVKYLQGNLEEADRDFNTACEQLSNNPRARAIFYNYHGDVLLKLDRPLEALKKIQQSRHLAEAEYYPDLVVYSRLSNANFLLTEKKFPEAQSEFQFVFKEAKKYALRRIETATLSGMSRLAEKLGDFQTARTRAVESLKISNEYILSLHQTVGLIVLGRALLCGNQKALGIAYLNTARDLAKSQGHFLRMNEAERELQKHEVILAESEE